MNINDITLILTVLVSLPIGFLSGPVFAIAGTEMLSFKEYLVTSIYFTVGFAVIGNEPVDPLIIVTASLCIGLTWLICSNINLGWLKEPVNMIKSGIVLAIISIGVYGLFFWIGIGHSIVTQFIVFVVAGGGIGLVYLGMILLSLRQAASRSLNQH